MPLLVTDALADPRLRLAAVVAEGVSPDASPEGFEAHLAAVVAARGSGLAPDLDARRQAARDALRHGVYKPTGRAKPAAEYLLRAASEGAFPRVNAIVDVANAASLGALVPLSLWDLDRARGDGFDGDDALVVRRGRPGEAYVFNGAGQEIDLADLVLGAAAPDRPCVTPVKDSLATKTTPATRRVGAVVYAPAAAMTEAQIADVAADLAAWLGRCGAPGGPAVRVASGLVPPGGTLALDPS